VIATGIVLFFVFVILCFFYPDENNRSSIVLSIAAVTIMASLALIIAGIIVFAWRYLP